MKNRNRGLSDKEKELVKLLMADCESTRDIQAKLKRFFARTIEQMLKQKWTSISVTRKIQHWETTPATAEAATERKQYQAITVNARYPFPVTATVNLSRK